MPSRCRSSCSCAAQRRPEHLHVARVGREQAFEDLDRRGLAGAVRAEQAEALAAPHRQREPVHGDHVAVALHEAGRMESRCRTRSAYSPRPAGRRGRPDGAALQSPSTAGTRLDACAPTRPFGRRARRGARCRGRAAVGAVAPAPVRVGAPRTADGAVNLRAPAPRTPRRHAGPLRRVGERRLARAATAERRRQRHRRLAGHAAARPLPPACSRRPGLFFDIGAGVRGRPAAAAVGRRR